MAGLLSSWWSGKATEEESEKREEGDSGEESNEKKNEGVSWVTGLEGNDDVLSQ